MRRGLCWIVLPKRWWKKFDPAYFGVALVVFVVGVSQQSNVQYLAFALTVVIVLLLHASWRLK